ncbi:hypothetical protein C2E23DRAFT_809798 [Lenzites betulinus]|nr:hypothetical protein C2E23DRAFT_809798 [Lenzites betulinus]
MSVTECDYFCNHVGRLSFFPSTCSQGEDFIARDCTCAESPIKQNDCLQSLCSPADFDAIVTAEIARCGPSVFPTTVTTDVPVETGEALVRRGLMPSFDGVDQLAPPSGAYTSSVFLFPIALGILVVGSIIYAHRRRRAQRAIQIEGTAHAAFVGY